MNYRLTAFLLVPLAGLFLLFHHAAYQPMLAQGDHGRDLYAFAQTLNGHVPYRDYWWVYGPIMPYYYALFFKIFGVAIPSVLVGKLLLTVISGVLIFFSLSLYIPPLFAFIAALWFWMFQPDFFFTYNHVGGLTCLMGITYALFAYIRSPKTKYLYVALFLTFILSLVKINFGLASLFVLIAFYRIYDRIYNVPPTEGKKLFSRLAGIITPAVIFLIYFLLFFGMPVYEIRQCMPYLSADQPYHSTPLQSLGALWNAITMNICTTPANFIFALCTLGALTISLLRLASPKIEKKERSQVLTAFALLGVLYFANLHEYLFSGVLYRSYWATPFSTMMLFFIIGYAISKYSSIRLQRIFFGVLFLLVFTQYTEQLDIVRSKKIPEQFLIPEHGRITTGNDENWFKTVEATTNFIQTRIPKNQNFFAIPYDPLYYYLTDRTSPSRQLIFFEHINIPPEQERKIIIELELGRVNYILVSNRAFAVQEPGLGVFGKTYCPFLGKYIAEHFQPIAKIGDWSHEPGWAWNHGVQILQRVR